MSSPTSRIILTGFSGTGKSAVAPLLAKELGWDLVDTDALVEERAGKRILEIFRDDGEVAFRDLEADALAEACSRERVVISTGGGAILRPENRRMMAEAGLIVCLEARPETIVARLTSRASSEPLDRPLLATEDPLARIRELKASRQHLYALCDWAVHTDGLTPEEVCAEVLRAVRERGDALLAMAGRTDAIADESAAVPSGTLHAIPDGAACMVRTALREYPVFTGWGILGELGSRLREEGLTRFAYVISDETVWHHLGDEIEGSLRMDEIEFDVYTVPPGEPSKSLEVASDIYDWLIEHRAERICEPICKICGKWK
jgi:shikimate kinase